MAHTKAIPNKSGNLSTMVIASFLFHIIFIVAAMTLPDMFPGDKLEPFGGPSGSGMNVVTVDLTAGTQGAPKPKPVTQQEPAPAKFISKTKPEEVKPLESKTSLPDPEPPKKKKVEQPAATKTLNQPAKERKEKGEFGTGKDVTEDAGKSGNKGKGQFGLGSFGSGDAGPGGLGTGTGKPFPFPWYIQSVFTKIELNWSRPFIVDESKDYVTVLYFVITRGGQVKNIEVEQSSGIAALDRSAESAVLGADPFPPLPHQWREPELAFRIRFNYSHQ